jgi:hypothetical protein
MNTSDIQFFIAPELPTESRDLLLLLRTLKTGIAKVSVHESKPVTLELRYPDLVQWSEVYTGPLSNSERELLALIRVVEYGDLYVQIVDLGKFQVLSDTVQRIRLGKIDWQKT